MYYVELLNRGLLSWSFLCHAFNSPSSLRIKIILSRKEMPYLRERFGTGIMILAERLYNLLHWITCYLSLVTVMLLTSITFKHPPCLRMTSNVCYVVFWIVRTYSLSLSLVCIQVVFKLLHDTDGFFVVVAFLVFAIIITVIVPIAFKTKIQKHQQYVKNQLIIFVSRHLDIFSVILKEKKSKVRDTLEICR